MVRESTNNHQVWYKMSFVLAFVVVCLWVDPVMAVTKPLQTRPVVEPFGTGQVIQVVLGLLLVLLVIGLVAWVMKRMGSIQAIGHGVIKPLSVISVGQRERLVLVQVGSDQLLLGVAPGHITRLHQLSEAVPVQQRTMPRGFAEMLTRFRKPGMVVEQNPR
ncbi:MAG TPA: flagellar biosynthetic protein FliO [Gammaproteobacteria bacterium]|nr:flagellar biosynthetic protein FliO [Gammaproteobacteria bacterium]